MRIQRWALLRQRQRNDYAFTDKFVRYAPITLFKRYVGLIDTIYSAGTITKGEIDSRWFRSSLNDVENKLFDQLSAYVRYGKVDGLKSPMQLLNA